MQEKRLKLYRDFRKIAQRDNELQFFDSKYKNFSDWEDKNFSDAAAAKDIWNKSLAEIYDGTLDQFHKKFCCDLQWAKDAGYCGSQNNQQNNQNQNQQTSSYSPCSITSSDIASGTEVSRGVNCPIVGEIQRALQKHCFNLNDDNKFGPITEGAVKNFQTKKGISPADGVVDKLTWDELQKSPSSPCPSRHSGGGSSRRHTRVYRDEEGDEEQDYQVIDL